MRKTYAHWKHKAAAQMSAFAHAFQGYRDVKVEREDDLWIVTAFPPRKP